MPTTGFLSDWTFNYTYDKNGNLLTRTRISITFVSDYELDYTWDYENRLIGVTHKKGFHVVTKSIAYTYEFAGWRICEAVTVSGVTTYDYLAYDGSQTALGVQRHDFTGRQWDAHRDAPLFERRGPGVGRRSACRWWQGPVWLLPNSDGSIADLVACSSNQWVLAVHQVFSAFGAVTSTKTYTTPTVSSAGRLCRRFQRTASLGAHRVRHALVQSSSARRLDQCRSIRLFQRRRELLPRLRRQSGDERRSQRGVLRLQRIGQQHAGNTALRRQRDSAGFRLRPRRPAEHRGARKACRFMGRTYICCPPSGPVGNGSNSQGSPAGSGLVVSGDMDLSGIRGEIQSLNDQGSAGRCVGARRGALFPEIDAQFAFYRAVAEAQEGAEFAAALRSPAGDRGGRLVGLSMAVRVAGEDDGVLREVFNAAAYNTAVNMSGIRNMAAASDSFDKGNYGDALAGNLLIGYAKADLLIGGPLAEGVGVVTRTAFAGLGLGLDAVGDAIANWAGSYATERGSAYMGRIWQADWRRRYD